MLEDSDLKRVIDKTALIENILNQVIEAYLEPRMEARELFWDILMHSSVLPLGSKVKVAMAISQELGGTLDGDALHNVMSLRNAFAHHATNAHPVHMVGKTPDADQVHYTLKIIRNTGRVTRKQRDKALSEFDNAYAKAKKSLVVLLDAIRAFAQQTPSSQQ